MSQMPEGSRSQEVPLLISAVVVLPMQHYQDMCRQYLTISIDAWRSSVDLLSLFLLLYCSFSYTHTIGNGTKFSMRYSVREARRRFYFGEQPLLIVLRAHTFDF